MQPCLDEATILAFGQGSVDAATKKRVEDHIAECDECRSLVMQVVRSSSMIPTAAPNDAPPDSEPPAAPPEPARDPRPEPSVIQAVPVPSVPPPPPGVNRTVIALAAIIVLIGAGAALSLVFGH
jgi:anti-sigma factor RsiW